MGLKRLTINQNEKSRPTLITDREKQTELSLIKFLELHKTFLSDKALEGLAQRTLGDHKRHMKYFSEYLNDSYRSQVDRLVDTDIFKLYISYMLEEKRYSKVTINLRLRTLKCYLNWLFAEGYSDFNFSKKIKLLKTPIDTIKPLSDSNIRKILQIPNKNNYAGFRDFTLMILMLDCGIRIGEACKLEVTDFNLKDGLLKVRPEIAKARIGRELPINSKTCKLVKELIKVAQVNNSEYVFQSSIGGAVAENTVIQNFIAYGKQAKIKERCTPHIFRHTFATNFIRQGGDIYTLQAILGHSTLEMCRKYIQLDTSDLQHKHRSVEMVDKYLR